MPDANAKADRHQNRRCQVFNLQRIDRLTHGTDPTMSIVPTTQPPDPRGHLVLERQEGETLTIGPDIEVKVTRIVHGYRSKVFLRIVAPKSIAIMRAEAVLTAPRAHQPHLPSQR